MIIDMVVPSECNTSVKVKVAEKLFKYKDLEMEISRMWGMKTQDNPNSHRISWTYEERTGEV